jgi:hypothetical protein
VTYRVRAESSKTWTRPLSITVSKASSEAGRRTHPRGAGDWRPGPGTPSYPAAAPDTRLQNRSTACGQGIVSPRGRRPQGPACRPLTGGHTPRRAGTLLVEPRGNGMASCPECCDRANESHPPWGTHGEYMEVARRTLVPDRDTPTAPVTTLKRGPGTPEFGKWIPGRLGSLQRLVTQAAKRPGSTKAPRPGKPPPGPNESTTCRGGDSTGLLATPRPATPTRDPRCHRSHAGRSGGATPAATICPYESPRQSTCEHSNSPHTPLMSSRDRTRRSGLFSPLIHTHQKPSTGSRADSTVSSGPLPVATVRQYYGAPPKPRTGRLEGGAARSPIEGPTLPGSLRLLGPDGPASGGLHAVLG